MRDFGAGGWWWQTHLGSALDRDHKASRWFRIYAPIRRLSHTISLNVNMLRTKDCTYMTLFSTNEWRSCEQLRTYRITKLLFGRAGSSCGTNGNEQAFMQPAECIQVMVVDVD